MRHPAVPDGNGMNAGPKSEGFVFGMRPARPLRGFPAGRVRIRQRNTDYARAFVKTGDGIRAFIIAEQGGYWVPYAEVGANIRSGSAG
jgi:hypothetical protein